MLTVKNYLMLHVSKYNQIMHWNRLLVLNKELYCHLRKLSLMPTKTHNKAKSLPPTSFWVRKQIHTMALSRRCPSTGSRMTCGCQWATGVQRSGRKKHSPRSSPLPSTTPSWLEVVSHPPGTASSSWSVRTAGWTARTSSRDTTKWPTHTKSVTTLSVQSLFVLKVQSVNPCWPSEMLWVISTF